MFGGICGPPIAGGKPEPVVAGGGVNAPRVSIGPCPVGGCGIIALLLVTSYLRAAAVAPMPGALGLIVRSRHRPRRSAAHREIADHRHPPWLQRRDQIIEDRVHDRFVKN